jgi:hypothetical protein
VTIWTGDDLERLGAAEEARIASVLPDGQADDLLVGRPERPLEVCMAQSRDAIARSARRMPRRGPGATAALATAALGALLLTAACGGQAAPAPTRAATPALGAAAAAPAIAPTAATSPASAPTAAASAAPTSSLQAGATVSPTPELSTERDRGETRVRFTVGDAEIIVRTADNPTSRDFVSMLPLTLEFRDFAAMEKLSYLPRRLTTQGSTGSAPVNGDLIYFVPWGNLGFFYNAERRNQTFDDRVIPVGAIETGFERLNDLEPGLVRVERIP